MPFDPNLITALETELEFAHNLKPGGQKVDPGRIAAIEEQIRLYKEAAKRGPGDLAARPARVDQSNMSTDYQSDEVGDHPKPVKETERQKAARRRAEAQEADKVETADATPVLETADAAPVEEVETTDA